MRRLTQAAVDAYSSIDLSIFSRPEIRQLTLIENNKTNYIGEDDTGFTKFSNSRSHTNRTKQEKLFRTR
jgi:hypothetical protein